MLINTDIKTHDISDMVCFQSVEYFYCKFKIYMGFTPRNYRKNIHRRIIEIFNIVKITTDEFYKK